jgi:hypothetical protein
VIERDPPKRKAINPILKFKQSAGSTSQRRARAARHDFKAVLSENCFRSNSLFIIFRCVKACSYCGRDNADDSTACLECGTDFPKSKPAGPPPEEINLAVTPVPLTDLSNLDLGFETVEGFSRPNWTMVHEFIKGNVPKMDLSAAWDFVVVKWLEQLAADLGGRARVCQSDHFYCLSDLESGATRPILAYAEFVVETICSYLRKAAWSGYYGKHVLLLFSDPDDYFAYISYYHRDGKHILSSGVFIRKRYAHISLPYINSWSAQHVLVHELAHDLLCHLPIPLWLNEGLAVVIEGQVVRRGLSMNGELADRHRSHWNETSIQGFWAGTTFDMPGNDSELSYSLAEVLVSLLSEKGGAFDEFIKAADWRDAGQDAAINILGQGLEEVAGGFLGPGHWRPQRKAIKENLKACEPAPQPIPPRP